MKEEIIKIILKTCAELNEQLKNKIDISKRENTELYGNNGVIDSLGLVNLIVSIETEIELKYGKSLILADGTSFPMNSSPFRTVNTFANYIVDLLNQKSF
ncbi:MAG: acyl carrier protein [Ignavibacteriaceae bacterium]